MTENVSIANYLNAFFSTVDKLKEIELITVVMQFSNVQICYIG